MKYLQLEMIIPAKYNLSNSTDTVAVFTRNLYKSGTDISDFPDYSDFIPDMNINYDNLSANYIDGLAGYLEQTGYFRKVYNCRDSVNSLVSNSEKGNMQPDFRKLAKADAYIFLDLFNFEDGVSHYYDGSFRTRAAMSWSVIFNNTTESKVFNEIDTLFFTASQFKTIKRGNHESEQEYINASKYLGTLCGSKLIPSWSRVDRYYYYSKNANMVKAEQFCKTGDWLKAAEIYNKLTHNKNLNIAEKAKYNMALVCEMEGQPDAALDWLNLSLNSNNKTKKEEHQLNCLQYIHLLNDRKEELESLQHQIKNSVPEVQTEIQ
jgi:hypothetical protein